MEDLTRKLLNSMIMNDTIIWVEENDSLIEEKRLEGESFSVIRNIEELDIIHIIQFHFLEDKKKYEVTDSSYTSKNVIASKFSYLKER